MPTRSRTLSRRLFTTLASLAIAVPMLAADPAVAADFVSIKNPTVNVRAQPNTQSEIRWELTRGYPLQIDARQGDWLQVRDFEGALGWVYAPLTDKTQHRVVTVPTANLRGGPGTNHKVVAKLERYEPLRTLSSQGEWVRVQRDGGQVGWIATRLTWGW